MKHYGALLTGANNTVAEDSSILTIGNGRAEQLVPASQDTVVIYNIEGPTGATDKAITAAGLVIVPSAAGRGETHVLGADGREIAIAGNFGSINDNTAAVPVKGIDGSGSPIFVNSIITEVNAGGLNYDATADDADTGTNSNATGISVAGNIATTGGGDLTVSGDVTITGVLRANGGTQLNHTTTAEVSDQYVELNSPVDGENYGANQPGGLAVVRTVTTTGAGASQTHVAETGGGLRFHPDPAGDGSEAARWEFNTQIADMSSNAAINGDSNWEPFASGTLTGIGIGQGISVATTGAAIDGVTPSAAEPVISLNLTGDGTLTTGVARGGLTFTNPTGAENTTVGIAANGINEPMLQVSNAGDSTTDGYLLAYDHDNTAFTWVMPGGTGSVNKWARNFQVGSTGVITVTAGTAGTPSNTEHGFTGSDFSVIVYEHLNNAGAKLEVAPGAGDNAITGSVRLNQVIPESVTVGTSTTETGASALGTVTVTLPTTEEDASYRVVIKS